MTEFALSTETRLTAGVLLLSVVAVESGVTLGIGVLIGP